MNIRATCPDCGDVVVTREDMRVRICAEDSSGSYQFPCPSCDSSVVRDAEERIIQLLLAGGVEADVWHLPAEIFERPSGPPISHDELLDFHAALSDDNQIAESLARIA